MNARSIMRYIRLDLLNVWETHIVKQKLRKHDVFCFCFFFLEILQILIHFVIWRWALSCTACLVFVCFCFSHKCKQQDGILHLVSDKKENPKNEDPREKIRIKSMYPIGIPLISCSCICIFCHVLALFDCLSA